MIFPNGTLLRLRRYVCAINRGAIVVVLDYSNLCSDYLICAPAINISSNYWCVRSELTELSNDT